MVWWTRRLGSAAPGCGLVVALTLMVLAMAVPAAWDWNVHVFSFPPLHVAWDPRVGPGSVAAIVVGCVGVLGAGVAASNWRWSRLLVGAFLLSVAWLASLATVDGLDGIGHILNTDYEYLNTARQVSNVSFTLHEYVERIPYSHPNNWQVHIAGHPPGALLFFVLLVRIGLGSGLAAGLVVLLLAATTPVAVMLTLRRLGAEQGARRAAPFLVLGPAAIWMAVSGDAVFGAIAAWGLCCLAVAATHSHRGGVAAWGMLSGLLLGYCVMMSYGLVLLGIVALAVLAAARSWRALPWAVAAALAVVGIFALAGFAWWEGYPVLRERYWDGVASRRPTSYWIWGNLAAMCFSAGPLVGSSIAEVARRVVSWGRTTAAERPVVWLSAAGVLMVAVADLSGMSKAEVERIWLPFMPWLLLGCAFLPPRWRRMGLALQVGFAVTVQHLFFTGW